MEPIHTMPIDEIIRQVTLICHRHHITSLYLIGSFAKGNATPRSDIDFAVKGCHNLLAPEDSIVEIETLRKIDIFDYDHIKNKFLLENIKKYGKQIY